MGQHTAGQTAGHNRAEDGRLCCWCDRVGIRFISYAGHTHLACGEHAQQHDPSALDEGEELDLGESTAAAG
jgi:hypothetical protein